MQSNTIPVGNDPTAPFVAFGDESIGPDRDTLVYAYVVIDRRKLGQLDAELWNLKKKYKIPQSVVLHCRQLMAPDQRRKLGIAHLTTDDARNLVADAITVLNGLDMVLRYSCCSFTDAAAALGNEIVLKSHIGEPDKPLPVYASEKALLGQLSAIALLSAKADGSQGPPVNLCQIITSEEKTRVKSLFGDGKTTADNAGKMFTDTGAPEGMFFEVAPKPLKANELAGLQLADIAAYVCSNAFSKGNKFDFCAVQLARVRFWTNANHPLFRNSHPKTIESRN